MTNVQFEDSDLDPPKLYRQKQQFRGLVGFLIDKKIAKGERGANAILIAAIVLCIVIIIVMVAKIVRGGASGQILPEPIPQMAFPSQPR